MKIVTTATELGARLDSQSHACLSTEALYKNPYLLIAPLIDGFLYVKNPLLRGAEQVINPLQALVLSALTSPSTPIQVAERVGLGETIVSRTIKALSHNELVRVNPDFPPPQPPLLNRSLSLWIHTSNRCNLACPYCYVNAERTGAIMTADMIDQLHFKIVQTVRERGVKSVQLKIAGGEPLITFNRWNSKLVDLKNRLESEGASVKLQIITNGTVLSDKIIAFITENNIGLGLSLDGYGDSHNRTRHFHSGAGSFDLVAENLRTLRANGIDPYITTVVTPTNLDGLSELTSFFTAENLRFRFSLEKESAFDLDVLISTLAKCYLSIEKSIPGYTQFLSHTLCDLSFEKPIADSPCGVGRSRASVNVNGSLHSCQARHYFTSLGSLSEERDLLEILQDPRQREELLPISESCEECHYRYVCGGGCPAAKVSNKSPFCLAFHALLPSILRLRGLTILSKLCDPIQT